jgi:hypothetical protein
MSQGRKRGNAGLIPTQRLSKLHKDGAAEANNLIIGRTWLDADQARAGDGLSLSKADRLKLRDVGQGEFYAFGPALAEPGVVHFRSDQVRTTHPRPGERHPLTALHCRTQSAEYWERLPTSPRRRRTKSEASMRRAGGSPRWSAKSNTSKARMQRSKSITRP